MSEQSLSLDCDVVLLPEADLASKAIRASKSLQQLGGLFTLDNTTCFPHLSLYMLRLKQADIEIVQTKLKAIAGSSHIQQLVAKQYYQAMGFVDVEYGRNESLDHLQQKIVSALNPVRNGMRAKDEERMLEAEGLALQNFQMYGYKYVGELFRSHMSLTRLSNEQSSVKEMLPELAEFNGMFTKLGLFEMGDNGTCVRSIFELPLL